MDRTALKNCRITFLKRIGMGNRKAGEICIPSSVSWLTMIQNAKHTVNLDTPFIYNLIRFKEKLGKHLCGIF